MKTTLKGTLSAGLVLASGLTGFSSTTVLAASERGPAITIHVRNYAGVAPQILTEAEQVATEIYRKAGVETRWTDIPLTTENGQPNSAGNQTFSPADIQLSIFPDVMSDRSGLSNNVMGLAPGTGPDRGIVYVFDGKVRTIFWSTLKAYRRGDTDRRVSMGQVLGHAIAHEVGHLLLNQQVHSPHGIMRGEWGLTDFRDISCEMLLFTPQQAEALQTDVRRRNAERGTFKAAELQSSAFAH